MKDLMQCERNSVGEKVMYSHCSKVFKEACLSRRKHVNQSALNARTRKMTTHLPPFTSHLVARFRY